MTAQPIAGLGNDAIPVGNAVNTPKKEPTDAQTDRGRGERLLVP